MAGRRRLERRYSVLETKLVPDRDPYHLAGAPPLEPKIKKPASHLGAGLVEVDLEIFYWPADPQRAIGFSTGLVPWCPKLSRSHPTTHE